MTEIIKDYGIVFLVSMAPLAELRGAIPLGIAMGLDPWGVWLASVLGNMVPVPFIILFIRQIFRWMKERGGRLAALVERMERKADRGAELFYRYELLGLCLLVAVPLPGTGAWTGALVAAMLRLRMKNAVPAIAVGVCLAGVLVLMLSHGISILVTLS